ncbi:hypothetical protein [Deinococcus wulumuqiensis]|uniref:hypothetical protein n=1 Tax=Deinococcus wulumuqiensis TaxID=980427 RepID=UPI001F07A2AD|nr:hypothetical protein [Deinococcus wulumuqiensis]
MRPQELTPTELAELLHRAYLQDLGEDVDEVDMDTRQRLANYLGCHEETRERPGTPGPICLTTPPR